MMEHGTRGREVLFRVKQSAPVKAAWLPFRCTSFLLCDFIHHSSK